MVGDPDDLTKRSTGSENVIAYGAKIKAINQILSLEEGEQPAFQLYDDITFQTKFQILNAYREIRYIEGIGNTYATFVEIAQEILPNNYEISDTNTKEIISMVGREMYRREMLVRLENDAFLQSLANIDESIEECAERLTEEFHSKRVQEVISVTQERAKLVNPLLYSDARRKAAETRGNVVWTDELITRARQLLDENRYPEGSNHAGKSNFKRVAEILSQELGLNITAKKLHDNIGIHGQEQ